jgi:hypothetical protein
MEAMRQDWTDDRLDDLSHRMDERFDRVEGEMDTRFGQVESEMNTRFGYVEGEMDRRFDEMDKRFDRVEGDIRELRNGVNALQRTMLQVGGGLIAANLTMMAAVIGLMVTQL